MKPALARGDVWEADFDPVRGHAQAGRHPAVIVSADELHRSGSELVYVMPITRTDRANPAHVLVEPPEGGLTARSFIMCDQMRIFAVERLLRRRGSVDNSTLAEIELRLRFLLGL